MPTTYYSYIFGEGVQVLYPAVGVDYGYYQTGVGIPTYAVVTASSSGGGGGSSASLDYSIAANSQYIPLLVP